MTNNEINTTINTTNLLNRYETRKIQHAKTRLNIYFNKQCQNHNIIPNYIKIKINNKTPNGTNNTDTSTKTMDKKRNKSFIQKAK